MKRKGLTLIELIIVIVIVFVLVVAICGFGGYFLYTHVK